MTSAYITLLTSESYVAGALVLALVLKKKFHTQYKLAILLDSSNISEKSLELIKDIYDDIIPINDKTISLSIAEVVDKLGRKELSITFSKILLWNQTKYDKLVYLDCDTLPLKSLDSLFDHEVAPFEVAASPDIGWPDIFNSGLLVLKPHEAVHLELVEFSGKKDASFDGADQGLLNEFFHLTPKTSKWKRLPFLYNVTPSDNYQYLPALTRFFKDINLLHFIGGSKPWHSKVNTTQASSDAKFHQLWWDEFNKYYTDESTRIGLLNINTIKGEGYKLDFAKLKNSWDEQVTDDLALVSLGAEEYSHPKIFPWEQRSEQRPPTRSFQPTKDGGSDPELAARQRKLNTRLNKSIETSLSSSSAPSSTSKNLKKSYEFNDTDNQFNPDKSLDEILKLPIKLLSKKREQEKK